MHQGGVGAFSNSRSVLAADGNTWSLHPSIFIVIQKTQKNYTSNKGVGSPGDYPRCEFRDRPDSWFRHGKCAPQGAHRAALAGTGPARAGRVNSTKRDRYERVHIALVHSRRANESLQELLCTRFTRFGEDLLRRPFLDDAAFVEEAHAV